MSGPIGVGITTRNRNMLVAETRARVVKHSPDDTVVVVVDDASEQPVDGAEYRFETNVGVARAKNKCLELLADAGCEHLFLFDDDTWPVVDDWWKPYLTSAEPHLMRIFPDLAGPAKLRDIAEVDRDSEHVAWTASRGPMIYAHRIVLDTVGGMDPGYGLWGWEHGDWSNRIHAAGLTTWRFADVIGAERLIYCLDEHCAIERSVPLPARQAIAPRNHDRYWRQRDQPLYYEYRDLPPDPDAPGTNVVLTAWLTAAPDPQRGEPISTDPEILRELADSVYPHDRCLAVLHDRPADVALPEWPGVLWVRCSPSSANPYFQRWINAWRWLRSRPDVTRVWCVDGTDVQMLRDPFPAMRPGRLYLGDEQGTTVGCYWMRQHHRARSLDPLWRLHGDQPLLNAGLIGGDRLTVMRFLHRIIRRYHDQQTDVFLRRDRGTLGVGDMAALNQVAYLDSPGVIIDHGSHVNTIFKAYEDNGQAWWQHK